MKILINLPLLAFILPDICGQFFYNFDPFTFTSTRIPLITTQPTRSPSTSTTTTVAPQSSNCTKFGQLLPDPKDCASFYVCLYNSCGKLHTVATICDFANLYFDPVKKMCTPNPVTGCSTNLPIPECQNEDSSVRDPTDPTRYFLCVKTVQTILKQVHRYCPPGLVFDDNSKICICKNAVNTTCKMSLMNPSDDETDCLDESELDYQPFYCGTKCTRTGIFADAYDCNRYHVCVLEKCNVLVDYAINCPKNMKFDAKRKLCSSEPSVKCVCTCRKNTFTCQTPGLFADVNCPSQYYECYIDSSIVFSTKRLPCPDGTFYNPKCQACTDTMRDKCDVYVKDNSEESSSSKSLSGSVDSEIDSNELCHGMLGRFPVQNEPTCFYHCVKGALEKKNCPKNHIFDRHKKICLPKKGKKGKKGKNALKKIKLAINMHSSEE